MKRCPGKVVMNLDNDPFKDHQEKVVGLSTAHLSRTDRELLDEACGEATRVHPVVYDLSGYGYLVYVDGFAPLTDFAETGYSEAFTHLYEQLQATVTSMCASTATLPPSAPLQRLTSRRTGPREPVRFNPATRRGLRFSAGFRWPSAEGGEWSEVSQRAVPGSALNSLVRPITRPAGRPTFASRSQPGRSREETVWATRVAARV